MKNLKFIAFVACFLAVACNKSRNDDYKPLTKEQKSELAKTIKGDYKGDLIFQTTQDGIGSKLDSLDIDWSVVDDTTIIIKQFPIKLLTEFVTDEALKDSLNKKVADDMTVYYDIFQSNPISFLLSPMGFSYKINIEDTEHQVDIWFYVQSSISWGAYYSQYNRMKLQIVEAAVILDKNIQTNYLSSERAFVLVQKKSEDKVSQ